MGNPLDGIRVVSLAQQYPGPYATLLLSDLGADVVIVEMPEGGDPTRKFPYFYGSLNRGKRSIAIDLKDDAGRDAFLALVRTADVLLEGFRPGTMGRLGLDIPILKEVNKKLVYVSISGFGQDGPYRNRPGHDLTYQAEAGMFYDNLLSVPNPVPPSLAIGDLTAGLFAVQAVLIGLLQRSNGDKFHYFDVSMFDCLISLLTAHIAPVLNGSGAAGFPYEPGYGVFTSADGSRLAVGVAHEDHFWQRLCDALGLFEERDLSSEERFTDHLRLSTRLSAAIGAKSIGELEKLLEEADVPFGRLRSLEELPGHPHIQARELFIELDVGQGVPQTFVRQPLRIDGAGPGPKHGVPSLGSDTLSVLLDVGLTASEVQDLVNRGVVGIVEQGSLRPTLESTGDIND